MDLEAEAVRLARLLVELMPDEPEVLSLLALLLFTSARTPARSDAEGHVVTLADQDRGRWNREAIAEGSRWLPRAVILSGGAAGPYQLQAHLAAAHSTATSWSETNWDRIIGLYDLLGSAAANPVVALNRAVAVTERDGPEHGLASLEAIVGLERSHLWHAALADNLRRLGRTAEAAGELGTAASLAPTEGGRRLLLSRLLDVRSEFALGQVPQSCRCTSAGFADRPSPDADLDLGDRMREEKQMTHPTHQHSQKLPTPKPSSHHHSPHPVPPLPPTNLNNHVHHTPPAGQTSHPPTLPPPHSSKPNPPPPHPTPPPPPPPPPNPPPPPPPPA